jgi:cardiolipin synthase
MAEEVNIRLNLFRTAPNLLTLLRICLAPFLVAAILESRYALSFGLFLVAGLTDALDGALARVLETALSVGRVP